MFISDLHLDPEVPDGMERFCAFLRQRASGAAELYILGDLFDHWIGDDDNRPEYQQVIGTLRTLTSTGTACRLLHGNRDFLLGRRFVRASGCQRLPDPSLVRIANQGVLLMHGDLLCTDDIPYQRFRRWVRNPLIKQLFLWQSLKRRRRIAANYRHRSIEAMTRKPSASMDVNPDTVADYLRRYQADRLIHGHTHRPGDHHLRIDQRNCMRQVLADWPPDRGEVLVEEHGRWWREPWGS
nr:UDP-2,3-diacylglucosamine diphosphatase [Rhabdochromatium marinum]